jgi:hypothetical protein
MLSLPAAWLLDSGLSELKENRIGLGFSAFCAGTAVME